ncbi:MAG: DUF350 domain-containing protein [Planctomycetota bacterium]|jgi:hypothetical protein
MMKLFMVDYFSGWYLGQVVPVEPGWGLLVYHLSASAIFSGLGILVLFLAIYLMELLTKFSITKEIVDEHNTALAIIVASVVIGIAMIISASVVG